jgi:hypothetical protein
MILDDYSDEAEEGTSSDVDTRCIGRDVSPHNTLTTLELTSGPTKSIDISGPWYDVEEGCYIEERAPGLRPCEQQGVHSAHTQAQPQTQTLLHSSTPLQDQTNQQGAGSITRSTSVESAVYSLPKPFLKLLVITPDYIKPVSNKILLVWNRTADVGVSTLPILVSRLR